MRLIQLQGVGVFFPGRTLFADIDWAIFRKQRVGLVGVNGAGKSTLLRIIANEYTPSTGKVQITRDTSAAYLPQSGISFKDRTLFNEAWLGMPDIPQLQLSLNECRQRLSECPEDHDLLEQVGVLEHRFHMLEGYRADSKVASVLTGLGFRECDFGRRTEEFSGGWQMRIALAKILLQDPDILLLDEPTNHLDLETVIWLETYLRSFEGAVVLVSHDRAFLDGMVTEIAELQAGKLTVYQGNYTEYEAGRLEREEQISKEQDKIDSERKHLEKFVERFRYKASKATQAQSRLKRLEKLEDIEGLSKSKRISFRFPEATRSGNRVLELKNVCKSYGDLRVFADVSLSVRRGERIALVGNNGTGKSTLCRLIAELESPTSGEIRLGHNVSVEFFAQEAESRLNRDSTVLEEAEADNRTLTQPELRGLLGAFLFQGDDVYKRVGVLSGGEKSRLALAKLLLRPANFIILDEPTNHLDMASQDVLLDALSNYGGTLIVVSHDRHFLDKLVDRVVELEDGAAKDWPGTFSEFMARKGHLTDASSVQQYEGKEQTQHLEITANARAKDIRRAEADIRNRYSAKINAVREICRSSESRIIELESRQKCIEEMLSDKSFYEAPSSSGSVLAEYKSLREELQMQFERWQEAEQELAVLEDYKNQELKNVRGTCET